ncbi:MAG: hypothetical protein ABJF01_04740 [bacterium]
MLALLLVGFAFQQTTISIQIDSKKGAVVQVVAREGRDTSVNNHKPIVATSDELANAFADVSARLLLAKARDARSGQDSSIRSYDASTLQRLTLRMAFTKYGRDRILFRHESAAHVRWARGNGAQIDITGKRTVIPLLGGASEVDIESILSPVPYYPGRDALWIGLTRASPNTTDDDIVHPLATSAEAYYTYRTGDSLSLRLPDGSSVQIRELQVHPRRANWHAVVGSLWFDTRTGQLVRAAYRLSQPIDLLNGEDDDKAGFITRAMLRPAEATITGVAVEYGLYQGSFWLPRSQVGEGTVQFGLMRMPMRLEEHFTYAGVNGADSLAPIRVHNVPNPPTPQARARDDSVQAAARVAECAATGQHSMPASRYGGALPVLVHIPCDTAALARSAALPKSIFDSGEDVFGDSERDALLARATAMMPDVPFALRPPNLAWGFDMLRYNRVEGLSSALELSQDLGSGYELKLAPRFGTADRILNADLSATRSNGGGTTSLTAYRRLVAANDWGHPLDFGSGLSALLFGRDEGFYYRTAGAELTGDHLHNRAWQWRIFSEQQRDAVARTNVSVPQVFGSAGFAPAQNITAARIRETGASLRNVSSFGLDPNGFRMLTDLRLEGAGGDRDYGRAALDVTLSHPLGRALSRDFSGAVTVSGGSSTGEIPIQRQWFLGGTSTVRGQPAAAMFGDGYWLTRTEVGYGSPGMRRIAFFDLGWAGDRTKWSEVGRPASGVGLGFSFLDGLIRADLARGIYPARNWRSALYLESKF